MRTQRTVNANLDAGRKIQRGEGSGDTEKPEMQVCSSTSLQKE